MSLEKAKKALERGIHARQLASKEKPKSFKLVVEDQAFLNGLINPNYVKEVLDEQLNQQRKIDNPVWALINKKLQDLDSQHFLLIVFKVNGVDYMQSISKSQDGGVFVTVKGRDSNGKEVENSWQSATDLEFAFKHPTGLLEKSIKNPSIEIQIVLLPIYNQENNTQNITSNRSQREEEI